LDRLGRALATVCNIVDPDTIAFSGGLSNVAELYAALPSILLGALEWNLCKLIPTRHIAHRGGGRAETPGASRSLH
jgi:predicted NBD/HSP70 family sugar kinase